MSIITAESIVARIWDGKQGLLEVALGHRLEDVEIVMGGDAWKAIVAALQRREWEYGMISLDSKPGSVRIWGVVARCDRSLDAEEIRFRSEVAL